MKIFWSWQSDTHQPTGRYFVRDVLNALARELNGLDAIDAAERPDDDVEGEDGADWVAVDHDMKGIAGHAPIAETILKKIAGAALFVADLTPIALTAGGKRVPNPNVMIELGYALKALGHERLVLIVNQAEGVRLDHLPFDLRHWSAPVVYRLGRDADGDKIAEQAEQLKAALKPRIASGLKVAASAMRESQRTASPRPELIIAPDAKMELPIPITQNVRDLGVPSLEAIKSQTPRLKLPPAPARPGIIPISPLSRSLAQFAARPPERWTREETEGYNRTVDHYYERYARHLDEQADHIRLALRSFEIQLVLENRGSAPASDIDVTLSFPPAIQLHGLDDGFPAGPEAPKAPPLRPLRSGEGYVSALSSSIEVPRLILPHHLRPLVVEPERNQARFHERQLKHYEAILIDPFLVSFRTTDDIDDFDISYIITVSEPIKPTEGTVRVTVRPDEPPTASGNGEDGAVQ